MLFWYTLQLSSGYGVNNSARKKRAGMRRRQVSSMMRALPSTARRSRRSHEATRIGMFVVLIYI